MANLGIVEQGTIANGETYSGEIDMRDHTLLAVLIPAAVDGTRLRIAMADKPGGTFKHVQAGDAAKEITADEWAVFVDNAAGVFAGWVIKLFLDDGNDNAATQSAARSLTIVKKRGA